MPHGNKVNVTGQQKRIAKPMVKSDAVLTEESIMDRKSSSRKASASAKKAGAKISKAVSPSKTRGRMH